MNIAIIVPRIAQVGPVKLMQTLVNSLTVISEIKITVFYIDRNADALVKFNAPVSRLKVWRFPFSDFDIVHTNGIRPDLFAFLYRKRIKYHISTIHNFVFVDLLFTYNRAISLIFGNIWLTLWRRADRLVCVSKSMKNYYLNWLPLSKLEVIYNGVAEAESISMDSFIVNAIDSFKQKGLTVIGSSGILNKRKGFDQILLLLDTREKLAFILFGEGRELRNLQNLAAKLNISDRIKFCGLKDNPTNYYKYLDFFVMPSRSEGFGLALVEAVIQKVPVICSDLEVFRELFNNEEVTFFKLENLNSLINATRETKENGIKKSDLAFSRYLRSYTDKLMARQYIELYQYAS